MKWLPGYRIVRMLSSRLAVVVHSQTGVRSRVAIDHLRYADPVSELILNTNIDAFPGATKLYFSADDIADLNWDAIQHVQQCDVRIDDKMEQIIRDRANDLMVQESPNKVKLVDDENQVGRYPKRQRRRTVKLNDYIVGFLWKVRKQTCFNRNLNHLPVVSETESTAGK
jgi:hypothetical protein